MLFTLLVVLIAVGGTVADVEDECRPEKLARKCDTGPVSRGIPNTLEDLKRDCRSIIDSFKCLDKEGEKCRTEVSPELVSMRETVQFLESHCHENDSLFQALSRNYGCIKPAAENILESNLCRWQDMNNLTSRAGVELPQSARFCQYTMYENTCRAHIIGMRCGQEAKDTATQILQNFRRDIANCREESIVSKLQPMKSIIEEYVTNSLQTENGQP